MTKSRPHGRRYPWGDLFSRPRFTLHRGVDYTGMSHGMASTVRQAARRLGVRVHIDVADDKVDVTVRTNEEEPVGA